MPVICHPSFICRYSKFDKAFLLAVDINARDLFMDMYYAALDSGQTRLAGAAKHKAKLCDEQMMFSGETPTSITILLCLRTGLSVSLATKCSKFSQICPSKIAKLMDDKKAVRAAKIVSTGGIQFYVNY